MRIYIAAGHGGNDPGAVANNTTERDEVEKIVNTTVFNLKRLLEGKVEIIQVPNNLTVDLTAESINEQDAGQTGNYCIEVHLNSNKLIPGSGTETYFGNKPMAISIQKKLVEMLGLPDRGVKDGTNLKFNRVTNPASCLVELGFINNPQDLAVVQQKGSRALTYALYDLVSEIPLTVESPIEPEKGLLVEIKSRLEQEIKNLQEIHDKIN